MKYKKYGPTVFSILKCKNSHQSNILLSELSDGAFDFVCECVDKVVNKPKTLKLNRSELLRIRKKLQKERKNLYFIANKNKNRNRKRTVIATQSGSGVATALGVLLPLIISGIQKTVQYIKKRNKK